MRKVIRNYHLGLVFTINDSAVTEKHKKECRLSIRSVLDEADPEYRPDKFTVSAESGKLVIGAQFNDEALALEVKAGHITISVLSEQIPGNDRDFRDDKDIIMAKAIGDVIAQQFQQVHYAQHGHMPGRHDCFSGPSVRREIREGDFTEFAARWPSWMPAPLNGGQLKALIEALRRHDRFLNLGAEMYGINSDKFTELDLTSVPVCCLDGLPVREALMFLTAYQSYVKSVMTEREPTALQQLVSGIVDRG